MNKKFKIFGDVLQGIALGFAFATSILVWMAVISYPNASNEYVSYSGNYYSQADFLEDTCRD